MGAAGGSVVARRTNEFLRRAKGAITEILAVAKTTYPVWKFDSVLT